MRYWWVALVACLVLLPPSLAHAAPGDPVEVQVLELRQEIAELKAEVTKLQAEKEHYEYLKEEAKALREYVQRERDSLQGFFMLLVGFAGGLAVFFGWNTRKEVAATAKGVRDEAIRQYKPVMKAELDQAKDTLEELVRRRTWYQNTQVLVVGQKAEVLLLANHPLKLLGQNRMDVVPAPIDSVGIGGHLKERENIVVYRYHRDDDGKQDSYLQKVIDAVVGCGKVVPLIVYAPGHREVTEDDMRKLAEKIPMHTMANNHVTLVSHIHSLARILAHAEGTLR